VLEAKARKKRKIAVKLDKLKKKAIVIANQVKGINYLLGGNI
jgi:predicted nucleic acid-binding protein